MKFFFNTEVKIASSNVGTTRLQTLYFIFFWIRGSQGGITCGAIDEPRKSSKAIDERVIIDFRDKNVVIARFRDINEVFI